MVTEQRAATDPMTGQPLNPFVVDPNMEIELRKIFIQLKAGGGAPPPPDQSETPA